jgi:UDP-N-acetylmuramoylalanine--D-glutamate ligase
MHTFADKKIGIWGFGVVGRSALAYLSSYTHTLQILEAKELSQSDQELLIAKNIPCYHQDTHLKFFLEHNDYIIPSPGVDLRPYVAYAHKWVSEFDLFQQAWKKPIIAITGSIGKTSVTTLLSHLFATSSWKFYTGGNIGNGILSALTKQADYDAALLEVSSFQLEHCKNFAPDLAIWTNFYPNHLDRHSSLQEYCAAKCKIFDRQTGSQQALIPYSLLRHITYEQFPPSVNFFSNQPLSHQERSQLPSHARLFYRDADTIFMHQYGIITPIFSCTQLPSISFEENWLIIISALYLMHHHLNMPPYLDGITSHLTVTLPEHRLEKVTSTDMMTIYNDSKATTAESTLAAVNQLQGTIPITLFLGGLSKGVSRKPLINALHKKIKNIYCFGKEAHQLTTWSQETGIPAWSFETLDAAVSTCLQQTHEPSIILFSPAGSSYDIFKDYQERGNYFKQLIKRSIGDTDTTTFKN